jgi:hypothetical protein
MKKEEINSQIKIITPTLQKFAWAMIPEEEMVAELISDAYSVFLIKSADDLISKEITDFSNSELSLFRKSLAHKVLKEIYNLALKKADKIRSESKRSLEYKSFYDLDLRSRAFLCLVHNFNYTDKDLKSFFECESHDLIEYRFNAQANLLKDYQDTEVHV